MTRIAVAVSTIGRDITPLLDSLTTQTLPAHQVVIADQSGTQQLQTTIDQYAGRLPVRRITTTRGVSHGRNQAAAHTDADAIFFTDDDCTLHPEALKHAADTLTRAHLTTGQLRSSLGARGQHAAAAPVPITRKNVWVHGIEATTAIRWGAFAALGGFDETLGVGADTPWQSGEGTELMLRAINAGMTLTHNPAIIVTENAPEPSPAELLEKSERYARGTGRVYAIHYNTLGDQVTVVLKPLVGAALRWVQRRPEEAARLFAVSRGRRTAFSEPDLDTLKPYSRPWLTSFAPVEEATPIP